VLILKGLKCSFLVSVDAKGVADAKFVCVDVKGLRKSDS
jgi:hypothetical protein